jgi:folylpolyglutamate synthase
LEVQIEDLPVIHIAGTKGKGSTCAFVESILRHHNLKTGLFTSPHLIEVTERFRINGQPIAKEIFAKQFWELHEALQPLMPELPSFFRFLTLLSIRFFLQEKVRFMKTKIFV